jgi:purine-binding chemotaxis protein CheW
MSPENQQKIDWEAVWKSLNWDDLRGSEEAMQARLHQRALTYAAPPAKFETLDDAKTVLVFALGEERYGIDVMTVRSVRTISHITRVPGTPAFYRGVVNVRGQVVTVMDLRLLFDISISDEKSSPDELIVAQANQLEIGLLAHNVEGVMVVPQAEIEPVDNIRHALGVTVERLVLLDIDRIFDDSRLIVGGKDEGS